MGETARISVLAVSVITERVTLSAWLRGVVATLVTTLVATVTTVGEAARVTELAVTGLLEGVAYTGLSTESTVVLYALLTNRLHITVSETARLTERALSVLLELTALADLARSTVSRNITVGVAARIAELAVTRLVERITGHYKEL